MPERSRIRADSIVDAQRNTMRALNSIACLVWASMMRTPVARPVLRSYSTLCTTL